MIAGFVGVVVLLGRICLTELGKHVWAQIALLIAALFYALAAVYARRLRGHKPVTIAAGQLLMAAALLLPFALLIRSAVDNGAGFQRRDLGHGLDRYVLHGAGVSDLLPHSQPRGRTNALLVTFLIPVSAILLGLLLLDERLDARQFAGMLAIAIGLAAIDGRPARFLARKFHRTAS